ncbi:MAG TPA: 1,4-dihydroxy-2-naphthoate polyprenyltransferase [Acidimicrobiales bacterium]|nr:1,4-dihydroxy-2-naphthoate polyprenyltransferase [Acidimicrobiales bacterium]
MTSAAHWFQGARPRTLGAAVSPVLVGTAVASRYGDVVWWRAGFCLLLAIALQVGVNYANDYSDGVRGVDTQRRGPVRLTASGLAPPARVKRAALLCFAVGGLLGIVLAVAVDWRLVLVGAASILAAALYSGGPKPYASSGLGEVMVLVFFGVVATCGSTYVHLERVPWLALGAAVPVGLLACAILLVNNLRDVDSDRDVGKRTLAVRVGKARTRALYRASIVLSLLTLLVLAPTAPGALLAAVAAPLAVPPLRIVASKVDPPSLVEALVATARLQLVFSVLLAIGLAL